MRSIICTPIAQCILVPWHQGLTTLILWKYVNDRKIGKNTIRNVHNHWYTSYNLNIRHTNRISINRISIYRISINRMKCSRDEMFDLSKFSSRRKTSVNELVLFCKNYRFFWRKRKCFKIKLKKCCQTFNR